MTFINLSVIHTKNTHIIDLRKKEFCVIKKFKITTETIVSGGGGC